MKKTISIALVSCVLFSSIGCKSDNSLYEKPPQSIQMGSSFNEEVYVWESFLFNTNSTSRTLRQ